MRSAHLLASACLLAGLFFGTSAQADVVYSVRENDTLTRVAAKYGVSYESIIKANPKVKNTGLKAGMVIVIPSEKLELEPEPEIDFLSADAEMPMPGLVSLDLNRAGDRHRSRLAYRGGSINANRLIDSARQHLGTPYMMGGTGNGVFDCSGFTMKMYQMYGVNLPRTADVQYYVGSKVPFGEEVPGDLVFFETYLPGPSHVGIYIGESKFIHASSSRGVTISSLNQPYYSSRYLGARRIFKDDDAE